LLTHMHPDHIGGAWAIADRLRCPVAAWHEVRGEAGVIDRPLHDGDVVEAGGTHMRVLHAPGHASAHVCLWMEAERGLIAGDVVAGIGTVVIPPPDGDMDAYLDTLHRLRALGPQRIYPGHGPVIEDGVAKLDEYLAHRAAREAQIAD